MSVTFGSNLVVNPGAETYSGVATGYSVITPAGWTATGDPTVAIYKSDYGSSIAIREPDGAGNAFFTGGPDTKNTGFSQTIDLSSVASQIDAGQVNFGLGAALGGFYHFNDRAQVLVNFENASGKIISNTSTGSVLATDRNNDTKLLYRITHGTVPALARAAQVDILFTRVTVRPGYNHAYADDVHFVVSTNTRSTTGITPAISHSTLPATAISGIAVSGKVAVSLTNNSTSENIGPGSVSLFASNDGLVDSHSALIAKVLRKFIFAPAQTRQLVIPVTKLELPDGTYRIIAQTSDQYGTVDTAVVGPSVLVEPATISLTAAIDLVAPAAVKAGDTITFTMTLDNSGNVNSTGIANLAVVLTGNGTTIPLATVMRRINVRSNNRPARITFKVRVPAGLSGTYLPGVTFTQGTYSAVANGTLPVVVTP